MELVTMVQETEWPADREASVQIEGRQGRFMMEKQANELPRQSEGRLAKHRSARRPGFWANGETKG